VDQKLSERAEVLLGCRSASRTISPPGVYIRYAQPAAFSLALSYRCRMNTGVYGAAALSAAIVRRRFSRIDAQRRHPQPAPLRRRRDCQPAIHRTLVIDQSDGADLRAKHFVMRHISSSPCDDVGMTRKRERLPSAAENDLCSSFAGMDASVT
jgi:hypothetical protein